MNDIVAPLDFIENKIFDEIAVGDSASRKRTLTSRDIQLFAVISGDVNPAHVDAEYAKSDIFHGVIGHGMWGASLISAVLGTALPGPGTIYLGQTLRFRHPVRLGDQVTVTVTVREKEAKHGRLKFDCLCVNAKGDVVIDGTADVMAPTEKVRRPRYVPPEVELLSPHQRFKQLMALTQGLKPARTAVVHPVDRESLVGALAAGRAGLIVPVLVGPEAKIRAAAAEAGEDLSGIEIVPVPHSHAAAERAVQLAHEGKVEVLMKGALHTDELMHEVVLPENGLLTERRISHVFVFDVPTYPRPLFITDAAINIEPDLDDKRDIVQNAIDLAHVLTIELPKVAILAAVETVYPRMRSTLDAAALCKMADRGQIQGGILDGPLAFDNAISMEAAAIKHIVSPVAGQADILVVPDIEAGNMLAKQLDYLAGAEAAGIVMGARVPVVLTSRADKETARTASCAVALLLAEAKRRLAA